MPNIYHSTCARCEKHFQSDYMAFLCDTCYDKETSEREESRVLKRIEKHLKEGNRISYLNGYEDGFNDCFTKQTTCIDTDRAESKFKKHMEEDTFKHF